MSSTMALTKGLSSEQLEHYKSHGYISGVKIFNPAEVLELNAGFERLCKLLYDGETPYVIDGWEQHNNWLYELVTNPRILDCVEDLLGPDFYQWGSNFLCKKPHEKLYFPWHQDLHDWPLRPPLIVTGLLAFDDIDEENGCLKVIPGSHHSGALEHTTCRPPAKGTDKALLPFHLDDSLVDESRATSLITKAGEMSFHHPALLHASAANHSSRRRCSFQICYAATAVKCDTSVRNENGNWNQFNVFMCRGVDEYRHHPHATPPSVFGRGPRKEYRELNGLMG